MDFSKFFIDRPVFAIVLSILIFVAGCLAIPLLPSGEYPEVVPPTVVVRATYPGANPKEIADSVAVPLEEAITGVEGMIYMKSVASSDGSLQVVVTFSSTLNPDEASVRVQNRVAQELSRIRISIAAQVAQSYADACGAAMQADVARETASIQGKVRDLTQRLLDAGGGTQRDVDQANVLVEQANALVPSFEGERRAQLYALATLTGRLPAVIDAAASQCRVVPKIKTLIPIGDGAALLGRRPDVRAAERKLAADTARIGVATASLFPSITLLGAVSLGAPKMGNVGKSSSFGYSLGPLISWTLPNFAATRAKIQQAQAGSDASLAEFQGTILAALRETEQALARYAAALEQNAALARAAESAQNAADQTKQRFDSGRDSFLDLLVAEQNRAVARQALAESDRHVADLQVSLFKALGGGWENAPVPLDVPPPRSSNREDAAGTGL